MPRIILGKVRPGQPKPYTEGTIYKYLDRIIYNGLIYEYCSNTDSSTNPDTNPSDWVYISSSDSAVASNNVKPSVTFLKQENDALNGTLITIPPYHPFNNNIHVYYNGLLLSSGIHYEEQEPVSEEGWTVTIKVLFDTHAGAEWEFHIYSETPTLVTAPEISTEEAYGGDPVQLIASANAKLPDTQIDFFEVIAPSISLDTTVAATNNQAELYISIPEDFINTSFDIHTTAVDTNGNKSEPVITTITVQEKYIETPVILSPVIDEEVEDNVIVRASEFIGHGESTHVSTDWRLSNDEDGTDVVMNDSNSQDLLQHTFSLESIEKTSILYASCRYNGESKVSDWAMPVKFVNIVIPPPDGFTAEDEYHGFYLKQSGTSDFLLNYKAADGKRHELYIRNSDSVGTYGCSGTTPYQLVKLSNLLNSKGNKYVNGIGVIGLTTPMPANVTNNLIYDLWHETCSPELSGKQATEYWKTMSSYTDNNNRKGNMPGGISGTAPNGESYHAPNLYETICLWVLGDRIDELRQNMTYKAAKYGYTVSRTQKYSGFSTDTSYTRASSNGIASATPSTGTIVIPAVTPDGTVSSVSRGSKTNGIMQLCTMFQVCEI